MSNRRLRRSLFTSFGWWQHVRPQKSGLGWTPARTIVWMNACQRTCRFLPDDPRLFDVWLKLVEANATCGKPAHDARLVASMAINGITKILTFNVGDFVRYGVTILDPRTMPTT